MDEPALNLNVVQRWMQAVVTHPGGVKAGLAFVATIQQLDVASGIVDDVITRSHSETSIERLSIYANAYFTRLIECLAAQFPIFRQTVGEGVFAEFAVDYLTRYPSQSYTLAKLGERFPQYLEVNKPSPADGGSQIGWADFLVDLARLERIFSEVFDGVGVEGQTLIIADDLRAIPSDRWSKVRLQTVPCLRLLKLRFPLNDFYTAARRGERPTMPQSSASWMAITRRDYIVRRYELSEPQFTLLSAIECGQTLDEANDAAAMVYPASIDELASDLREWFRTWTAAPMFAALLNA